MTEPTFWKQYRTHLIIWIMIIIGIIIALRLGVDQKVVVFLTLVLGLFTQAFAGLGALIAAIPFVGPLIVKVLTIPFFWLLNALGYFVSALSIKKGYTRDLISSRILTIALLVGIVLGYILGHIVPLR